MIEIYVRLIIDGKKQIDDVPEKIRSEVESRIRELEK